MSAARRLAVLHGLGSEAAAEIVRAGLARSFSEAAVARRRYGSAAPAEAAAVAIEPGEAEAGELACFAGGGRKLLLLGALAPRVAARFGLPATTSPDVSAEEALAHARLGTPFDASPAAIRWHPEATPGGPPALPCRAFCRFDFEEEWNHLGHGRIPLEPGPWSAVTVPEPGDARALATVRVAAELRGVFAALHDAADAAALWIGRAVGPVDGLDWTVVERFFSDHRAGELACWPCWSDLPAGHGAGATFRLDCDEAVASARPLFERYRERGVPVSLALRAGHAFDAADRALVRDVLAAGGTLLSHSLNHLPDWGRDEDEARAEARASRARLEALAPDAAPVRFAVSPFHRNPSYAIRALAESGYHALVSGIIVNDPECLLGRAGALPFARPPLVSHSQQHMLHGDCFRRRKDSIAPWQEGFENHRRAEALYGYLDHPFSERYAYGWADEAQRMAAHEALLDVITAGGGTWLPSLGRALSHLVRRSRSALFVDDAGRPRASGPAGPDPLAARLAGRIWAV